LWNLARKSFKCSYYLVQVKASKFEAITTSSCGVLFGQCQNGFFGKNICITSNFIHFLVSNMRQVYTRRTSASDFFLFGFNLLGSNRSLNFEKVQSLSSSRKPSTLQYPERIHELWHRFYAINERIVCYIEIKKTSERKYKTSHRCIDRSINHIIRPVKFDEQKFPTPGLTWRYAKIHLWQEFRWIKSSQTGDQKPTGHERHLSFSSVYPSSGLGGFHKVAGRYSRSSEIVWEHVLSFFPVFFRFYFNMSDTSKKNFAYFFNNY
jgi:hypothetical protein